MSVLRIDSISKPTPEQWERIENKCDYATFYQTHIWHKVLCSNPNPHFNNLVPEDASQLLRFSDGIEMLLPMVKYKKFKGIIHLYSMSPDDRPASFLSEHEITAAHEQVLFQYLTRYNLLWRQSPFRPVSLYPGFEREDENNHNMIIDMRGGTESLKKKFNKEFLRQARQAPNRGVTVSIATTLEEWREFYQLYLESSKRWDGPMLYSWSVLEAFHKQAPDKAQLWAAWADGKMVAGNMVFCHNHTATAWFKGGLKEYFNLKAPKYLDLQRIEYYAQQGYWWFDMGRGGDDPGVIDYKIGLGCENMDGSILTHKSSSLKAYERVRWETVTKLRTAKGRLQKAIPSHQ